jgi:hypothetical protein
MNNNPLKLMLIVSIIIAVVVLAAGVLLASLWQQANAGPEFRRIDPQPEGYRWDGSGLHAYGLLIGETAQLY